MKTIVLPSRVLFDAYTQAVKASGEGNIPAYVTFTEVNNKIAYSFL